MGIIITWFVSAVRGLWKSKTAFLANWRSKSRPETASGPLRTSWSFSASVRSASRRDGQTSGAVPDSQLPSTADRADLTCFGVCRILRASALRFRGPIAQLEVFLYFTAFVTVLFRFVGTVIDLAEGMFGVTNHVGDYVEGLRH